MPRNVAPVRYQDGSTQTTAPGQPLATAVTNTSGNTVYPEGSYFRRVVTADGFPVTGFLTGTRSGTSHTQRLQDEGTGATHARQWLNASTAWSPWHVYLDAQDVDAKGDLFVGTGQDTFARLPIGAEGTIPVSRAAAATGIAWEAPATSGGGNFPLFSMLTADFTSSVISVAGITGLSLTLAANTRYYLQMRGLYTAAAATTGVTVGLAGTAQTGLINIKMGTNLQSSTTATTRGYITTTTGTSAVLSSSGTIPGAFNAEGTFTTGATGGTFMFSAATEIAASTVTVLAGSYMQARAF